MTGLHDQVGVLGAALAQWDDRDRAADKAAARRASITAVGAVDDLLRQLYVLRGRLVREIRAADDARHRDEGQS
jgi:hypothetical protein